MKPSDKTNARLISITPAMARKWLDEANTHNRKVYQTVVDAYARDMESGRWKVTNQGIAFSPNGVLLDGQHRLWAIIQSGRTVKMYVFYNVSKDCQLVIDQGKPRSVADAITLQGGMGKVTNQMVATLRAMLRGGKLKSGGAGYRKTVEEERDLLAKHWSPIMFAEDAVKCTRGGVRGVRSATMRAVIARAWYSQDHDELLRFCDVLNKGVAPSENDRGALLLWQFLVQSQNNGSNSQQLRERYLKTERALDAFLKGEPIQKLYAASGELFLIPDDSE